MSVLICGSIAYDTIMVFQDHFKKHILPEQIHILNVSFLEPDMRRDFGGCAGNIAYALKLLGGAPLIMATAGQDAAPYRMRLADLDRKFDWGRSSIRRDRRLREHRQTGGGVPSASLARLVGGENGGSSGGAMSAGSDRTRRWDGRPRQRSPRGGGATGRCSGGGRGGGGGGARHA